jgi:methionyl-tRNA formyltransferase
MWMTEGLDEGPTFLQLTTPIGGDENAEALGERLSNLGAECLAASLDRVARGEIVRAEQDASRATYAPKIAADAGRLSFALPPEELARRVRAFTPEPGAYLESPPGRLLVTVAAAGDSAGGVDGVGAGPGVGAGQEAAPGAVLRVDRARGLEIALERGSLWLARVRPSGRRDMTGYEYANGARLKPGDILPGTGRTP